VLRQRDEATRRLGKAADVVTDPFRPLGERPADFGSDAGWSSGASDARWQPHWRGTARALLASYLGLISVPDAWLQANFELATVRWLAVAIDHPCRSSMAIALLVLAFGSCRRTARR
jgi:hypothetical protein